MAILVAAGYLAWLYDRKATKAGICPACKSKRIKTLDTKTENIAVDKILLPGVGGTTHVTSTVTQACQACGHKWQKKVTT